MADPTTRKMAHVILQGIYQSRFANSFYGFIHFTGSTLFLALVFPGILLGLTAIDRGIGRLSQNRVALYSLATMLTKLDAKRDIRAGAVRALVLCGGQGTRLRSVVADRPKSMASISGTPFLQLLLDRLRSQGVDEVILGTGYMADKIESYFGSGTKFGVHIRYSREREPLGTAGAVKLAEPLISDPVLILNGDSYLEWSLIPMLELFTGKNADLVMVVQAVSDVARYGSVALDHEGRVIQFVEKGAAAGPGLINAGVYLLRKQIVRNLPAGTAVSLERDVFPRLLDRGVYGLISTGLFIDIGIPEDFKRAQTLLLR